MGFRLPSKLGTCFLALVLVVGVDAKPASADTIPHTSYEIFPGEYQEQEFPHRLTGRLLAYFTGYVEQCTASVMGSTNESTIVTAAHCLGDSTSVPYYVEFMPGARDTVAPYDRWEVTSWSMAWALDSPYTYSGDEDVAFGLVCAVGADTIEDYVGGHLGYEFNASRDELLTSLDYPGTSSASDLGRQHLNHSEYGGTINTGRGPDANEIGADASIAVGGSSGSSVLKKFGGTTTGTDNRVTSVVFGIPISSPQDVFYTAHLGNEAGDAWTAIEAATPSQC